MLSRKDFKPSPTSDIYRYSEERLCLDGRIRESFEKGWILHWIFDVGQLLVSLPQSCPAVMRMLPSQQYRYTHIEAHPSHN